MKLEDVLAIQAQIADIRSAVDRLEMNLMKLPILVSEPVLKEEAKIADIVFKKENGTWLMKGRYDEIWTIVKGPDIENLDKVCLKAGTDRIGWHTASNSWVTAGTP